MYLLVVNFIQPPEVVAPHRDSHAIWVKNQFEKGIFLCAGPKKSKLGGVILAKSMESALLKKILSEDSYVIEEVAEYQIIDFDFTITTSLLEIIKTYN